jgi:hypothetical protein
VNAPQEPTEEQLLDALRRVKVDDVVLQTVATLVNLAGQKLTVPEAKDVAEAKKAIDAARAMLPLVPEEAAAQIKDALSQIQMIYVREQQQAGAQPDQPDEPAGPSAEDEERAKARAKIWTPGS